MAEISSTPGFTGYNNLRDFTVDMLANKLGVDKHRAQRLGSGIFGDDVEQYPGKGQGGLADWTPFGVPEAARRATKAATEGNLTETIAQGLGAIPGVGPAAKKVTQKVSPLIKQLTMREQPKQITSTVPNAPGKAFRHVQLAEGQNPIYGTVDRYDDSLMNVLTGSKQDNDFHVLVSSIQDEGDIDRIRAATAGGGLTEKQGKDALHSPYYSGPFSEEATNTLADRGLIVGNTLKSGGFGGVGKREATTKARLEAAMAIAQTNDLKDLTGDIFGSRVSGAKVGSRGTSKQRLSIPQLIARGQKRNIAPAEDLTLGQTGRQLEDMKHGRRGRVDDTDPWDDQRFPDDDRDIPF